MTWQRSLQTAVRALKKEETQLVRRLEKLRSKIDDLEVMAKDGLPPARRAPSGGKRRLSPAGRAAISKAAKKRWARYRSEKSRHPRRKT